MTPQPDGLVLQVTLRETLEPFDGLVITPIDREGPAVAIYDEGDRLGPLSRFPETLIVVRYPTGEVLEHVVRPSPQLRSEIRAARRSKVEFDFDGDGLVDRWECDLDGWAYVRSGADGSTLWSQHDSLEYEDKDRLTPLGDLDGDGCSELAVLHPRDDRSSYDFEPLDRLFGAKSWLSVVSGARVGGR